MATLFIVATPIGNLEDISMRALRILGEVDFVLCEDTRVTSKLLSHYQIKTPTMSYHQHSGDIKENKILDMLAAGKNIALVSDAGTPGISDPGGLLVKAAIDRFGDDIKIESVPGPSAATAALSISGIATDKFVFMGFPPHKKGRQTFIFKIFESAYPVVIYESKHRIIKFLEEVSRMNKQIENNQEKSIEDEQISNFQFLISNKIQNKKFKKNTDKEFAPKKITSVVVCRELSKMHETVYRGELEHIIEKIKNNNNDQKGEFTVILGK